MITTKVYFDKRCPNNLGECPIKITMTLRGKSAHLPIGVRLLPSQWDDVKCKVKDHPKKAIMTSHILKFKLDVDDAIMCLKEDGKLKGLTITEIKNLVSEYLNPSEENSSSFYTYFVKFGKSHKAERTKAIYAETADKLRAYKRGIRKFCFEDITIIWLKGFEEHLSKTENSANSRNIHLRNIRAAFNSAIDEGLTNYYPFRKYKIKPVATKKRSLLAKKLKSFLFAKPDTEAEEWSLDFARLSFLLIGINTVDLCNLTELTNGRIEYNRAKTGRHYSVLVPQEAMEIIERHRGKAHLIDALDRYASPKNVTSAVCRNLHNIAKRIPGMPKVSMYWMRHSWATIASSLDIPKEAIAAGLGHGGNTVTDIYIDYDLKKVDQANRLVIDHIFK